MGDIYGFNRETVRRIGRMLREHESRISTVEGSAAMRRKEHMRTGNDFEFGFSSADNDIVVDGSTDLLSNVKHDNLYVLRTLELVEGTTNYIANSVDSPPWRDVFNLFARPIGINELCFLHRHYRTGKWLAVPQTPQCVVHFQATATMTTTDADVTANVVHCLWGPYADDDTITVKNTFNKFEAVSGDFGRATGDKNGDLWIDFMVDDLETVELEIVTDVKVDDTGDPTELIKTVRTVTVRATTEAAADETIITISACSTS